MASSSPVADQSSPNNGAGSSIPSSCDIPLTDPFATPAANPIELNDVLEPSFLDLDPAERSTSVSPSTAPSANVEQHHPVQWWRTPTNVTDYGKVVRPSPFSALMASRASPPLAGARRKGSRKRANRMMDISPVILPRDGDRTPTTTTMTSSHMQQAQPGSQQQKSRKELRRERKKLKRKNMGTHHQPHGGHQYHYAHHNYAQHHYHRHYPNAKTRGVAGVQRSGGHAVSSAVPPLSL